MSEDSGDESAPAEPDADSPPDPEPDNGSDAPPARADPRPALLAAFVAIVAVAVFAVAIGGGWIYDDHDLIELNPFIHSFHYWKHWLTTDLWNVSMTTAQKVRPRYYRPLVTLSYAVDWALGGGSPIIFHLTNLVWEAAAGALSFYTLRRWLGAWLPALLAALLFVVHPTKAQSVAWIAGRIDVMCTVGLLVASTGVAWRLSGRRGGVALEITGTLVAYLTKETAVVLPAFVVLETWVALGRPAIDVRFALDAGRKALPQLGVALVYLGLHQLLLPIRGGVPPTSVTGNRVELVLATLGHTAELVVFPWRLMMQHGLLRVDPGTGHTIYSPAFIALGAVALLALIAGAWLGRRRAPGITLGLLFFVIAFLPTSNVMPTRLSEILPQRFLYLPLLGLALVVGELVGRARRRHVAVVASGLVAVAFATRSVARASDFSSERRLWQRELVVNPTSTLARAQLAYVDIQDHHYSAALDNLVGAYALSHRWFRPSGNEVDLIFQIIDLLVYQTPDASKTRLERIDQFVVDTLGHGHGQVELSLDKPRLHAALDLDNAIVRTKLAEARPSLVSTHADIQSRVGDPDAAARAAEQSYQSCRSCSAVGSRAALVLARSGRYAEAQRILDALARMNSTDMVVTTCQRVARAKSWHRRAASPGPAGLVARARELSILGAYGRAYAVLSPHEDAIRQAPQILPGYAELAWRAGYHDVARRVLAGRLPNPQIEELTRKWSERTVSIGQERQIQAH